MFLQVSSNWFFGTVWFQWKKAKVWILQLYIGFHRFFSKGANITASILASPGSTRSTGLSPWSVRILRAAPASQRNLKNIGENVSTFDMGLWNSVEWGIWLWKDLLILFYSNWVRRWWWVGFNDQIAWFCRKKDSTFFNSGKTYCWLLFALNQESRA